MPILAGEAQKASNWKTRAAAERSSCSSSLRQLDPTEAEFVLHPVGNAAGQPARVPLDLTLDKVGSQKPSDANRFALSVSGAG